MFSFRLGRIFIYITFWSIVFVAFYLFFWRGSLNELNKRSNKIDNIEKSLAQIQKYIDDWPVTAERELQEAEKNLEAFFAKIPEQEDIPEILRKIQEYGVKNSQLNLKTIENEEKSRGVMPEKQQPKAEGEAGKYAKSTYRLVANGNYFDIIKFLRNLETMERLINIDDFDLNSDSDADGVDVVLIFSIFYSKPK
jgi:Tfp pilus assembly protein PilO